MEVHIDGLAKRYASHWVFRNLSAVIPSHSHVAITGPNGAGKSTLLKIISGALYPSEGVIRYLIDNAHISPDKLFMHLILTAPYAEMIEEMTLMEAFRFHSQFRAFHPDVAEYASFCRELNFEFRADQQLQLMSSGMKQRLRLAFALCTQASLLLLDEPTSNLDTSGIRWFHAMLDHFGRNKTVIIASNVEEDLRSCAIRMALGQ
ncbi:MAG TPA: ATP-binding cassette domain-containing protein [Saprospiraceae bacterium]|nr:ATP-binding cassette domain-containing protein [Saprospiraceae bacterium]